MEDVTKLPKWAQSRIRVLESSVAHAKARLADVLGEKGDPAQGLPVSIGFRHDSLQFLPRGARVNFRTEEKRSLQSELYVHMQLPRWPGDRPMLKISGGGCITVHPEAGNAVGITLDRFTPSASEGD